MSFATSTLAEKKLVAEETYECTFSIDEQINFKPGQYVWVILPELAFPDQKGSRRAFSICSSALNQNSISILFRDSPSGFKQSLLNMQEGSTVQLSGPYGSSYAISDVVAEEVILVAGGVGIAPFLGMLRSYETFTRPPKLSLFYSNSSREKECFGEELEQLCSMNNTPFLHPFSRFESNLYSAQQLQQAKWFICGPAGMVDDVATKLRSAGVSPSRMHFEQMYPKDF